MRIRRSVSCEREFMIEGTMRTWGGYGKAVISSFSRGAQLVLS